VRLPALLLAAACALGGCKSFGGKLPDERPRLADMEEPLELQPEPDDEAARQALPAGGFTGIYVADAPRTLESLGGNGEGLRVLRVVENSPGAAAGVAEDDLLLEVRVPDGRDVPLLWASEWRQVELDAEPGTPLEVTLDRGGMEERVTVEVVARVAPPQRRKVERFREDARVGVVLRRATEVEAREAGLGPGGGAVVVGLSRASPWRSAGLVFGDVLVRVDGEEVAHPQVVLDAIRDADADDELHLEFLRDGGEWEADVQVTRRAQELTRFRIPLLFSYESRRGETDTWMLLGLLRHETTEVAWKWRLLWFITFTGGESDELVEVDE
jgi:C-terminal processing protease CtpA/Prc